MARICGLLIPPASQAAPADSIEPAAARDLSGIVRIHMRSFPGFFLTQLGPGFLRCFYSEVLRDASGILLAYRRGGELLGFVAGTAAPAGFYRRILVRRWHRFAAFSVVPFLRSPSIVPRLLNAFRKPSDGPADSGCGLLMSIAVDPDAQTKGIGGRLVHRFVTECRARGLSCVRLTTDSMANERVNAFYAKLGFRIFSVTASPQGRLMNDYRMEILPPEASL